MGLCIFGYFYENKKQKVNYAKRDAIILAYKQNKTLKCGNYDVNKTNFDIAEALSSFTSKRGVSDEFKGLVIKMKECKTDE